MKLYKLILLIVIALTSANCTSTQGQRTFKSALNGIKKSNNDFQLCYTRIALNPKYEKFKNNLAIKGEKADLALLSNQEQFTKSDKSNFLEFYAEHQKCDQEKLNNYGKVDPSLQLLFVEQLKSRDEVFLKWFEAPEITYGQLNKDIEYLREQERKQNLKWGNEYAHRLNTIHNDEVQQRQTNSAEIKSIAKSIIEDIVEGLILLGKTQTQLASQQQTIYIKNEAKEIVPYTPSIVNTTCRKELTGTLRCTTF